MRSGCIRVPSRRAISSNSCRRQQLPLRLRCGIGASSAGGSSERSSRISSSNSMAASAWRSRLRFPSYRERRRRLLELSSTISSWAKFALQARRQAGFLGESACSSSLDSASGSGWRERCRESDSPGKRPLPSHSMGASISVEGLNVETGRAGADCCGAGVSVSAAGAPPYFESDSPGSTKAAGA